MKDALEESERKMQEVEIIVTICILDRSCSLFYIFKKNQFDLSQVKNARKRQVEEEREEEARKIQRKERYVLLVCK